VAAEASKGGETGAGSQRLDQWLFFARLIKSRTLAATLIGEGKFRLNTEKVDKPSVSVKPGDVLTSTVGRTVRIIRVAAIGTRRGPAAEAQGLYDDLTPPPAPRPAHEAAPPEREAGAGRPTKKERRQINKVRGR
jgi:ribosome-associated heat shock protein Hsp15